MPIRPELRWLYPIDWPQITAAIRFERAGGRCEHCARPHGRTVLCLGDGRWWDADAGLWRDGRGRALPGLPVLSPLHAVRATRVVLATAHRNHDPGDNRWGNLAALCQRCHMLHDRPEHQRRRRMTLRARLAVGDLFDGLYVR